MESFIGATRDFSVPVILPEHKEEKPLTKDQERLILLVPLYPHEILFVELARLSGLKPKLLHNRLYAIGDRGLIAEDEGMVTRLRRDLSNVR
ncbi:MAG: hypothetical protein ACPKOP_04175 [Sphaerochaetaceae bacterium]